MVIENCSICGCLLHRSGGYAKPTVQGRAHASTHHHVAERFFGRSANRRGEQREKLFNECPWGFEGKAAVFCFDCHEELLHNPVLLPTEIKAFAELVSLRGLSETAKTESRVKLAGRVKLFQEVIAKGIHELLKEERAKVAG